MQLALPTVRYDATRELFADQVRKMVYVRARIGSCVRARIARCLVTLSLRRTTQSTSTTRNQRVSWLLATHQIDRSSRLSGCERGRLHDYLPSILDLSIFVATSSKKRSSEGG